MENIIIQDICEVYLKDLVTNEVYFLGVNTKNDINQKVKQDILKGGIGNKPLGVLQSEKEIDFSVKTLTHSDIAWMIQSGSNSTNGAYTVQKNEQCQLKSGKLAITGTPKGNNVVVVDKLGKNLQATVASGQVTVTGGTEGEWYTVVYPSDVTGNILTLDTTKFPHSYYVEMHTIAYSQDNVVLADLFYVFNKALPDGTLKGTFEPGKNDGDEIKFKALAPTNSSEIGKYICVPRA